MNVSGPGSGPAGVPAAIALSPILSARYRPQDLEAVQAAAPGSQLLSVSLEGLADDDLSDVEVLLRGPMPAATFDRLVVRCPRLRWVHSATAGVERVLTPTALERGLAITNARGVFSRPVAEYVLMVILAVSRRLPQLLELQRERTWQPLPAVEMREISIGIIGLGSIGTAIARLATAFGCRVLAVSRRSDGTASHRSLGMDEQEQPPVEPHIDRLFRTDELPVMLGQCDFAVLALPLTPSTDNLFDDAMFQHMKPGSWLINIARGRLVDDRALGRAVRQGRIGGAVLDTFRDEPLPADSPLYELPNVIITPHTSWWSGRVLDRSIALFCENLGRFSAGQPLHNLVDPDLGY